MNIEERLQKLEANNSRHCDRIKKLEASVEEIRNLTVAHKDEVDACGGLVDEVRTKVLALYKHIDEKVGNIRDPLFERRLKS